MSIQTLSNSGAKVGRHLALIVTLAVLALAQYSAANPVKSEFDPAELTEFFGDFEELRPRMRRCPERDEYSGAEFCTYEKIWDVQDYPLKISIKEDTSANLTCAVQNKNEPATIHWLFQPASSIRGGAMIEGRRIQQGADENVQDDEAHAEKTLPISRRRASGMGDYRPRVMTENILNIPCVTKRHAGVYTCVADTPLTRVTRDYVVEVEDNEEESSCKSGNLPMIYMIESARMNQVEGERVQLFCRPSKNTRSVSWTHAVAARKSQLEEKEAPVTEDSENMKVLDNGDLLVTKLPPGNNYFTCRAENEHGVAMARTEMFVDYDRTDEVAEAQLSKKSGRKVAEELKEIREMLEEIESKLPEE